MNKLSKNMIPDARVFDLGTQRSLADVLAACEANFAGTELRDVRSALRFLEARCCIDLGTTLARPEAIRRIFDGLSPAQLGVSEKRLANVQSLVGKAVKAFGMRRTWITREIEPSDDWKQLLARIPDRQHRWGISQLACYCTVQNIAPAEVDCETLRGLHAALEAEELSKNPRNLLKHTIAVWNICGRRVPGWPNVVLGSPFKTEPYMLPLEAFPRSFQDEVAAFEARMNNPDPLDLSAPVRALRPDTLQGYRHTFRRVASALVRGGHVPLSAMTGLHVLVGVDHFKQGLLPFLPKCEVQDTGFVYKMALQLVAVARQHLRLEAQRIADLEAIAARLKPANLTGMGQRNRQRLEQFDDETVVQRLLHFPEEELGRALAQRNPFRRAKGVERALAISMLIFTGIRVKNLRQFRIDQNIRRAGKRVFIRYVENETKTHAALDLELPAETIALLDAFLEQHRGQLPCADSPWIFPGQSGDPRSYSAMRDAVGRPLRKHAGIELSPHLYRHIIAKIVDERAPGNLHNVSRMLGHRSIRTTYGSYLGTEGPAASRRIADLLRKARDTEE